jgi:hypothetical protein
MAFRFGESTRWDVLRQSIVDPEQGLLASLDATTRIGLMIYTGRGGLANPLGCPLITQVGFELGNVDQVRSLYLASEPMTGGDTPTGESIDQAVLALGAIVAAGPKYILLATDGEPDTCQQPKPSQGMPQALAAAERAFAQGLRVYTLGVSDGLDPLRVQQMANAGAGKDPDLVYGVDPGAEPPLFANSDPQQLAQQLRGVIGDVRTCTVSAPASPPRARSKGAWCWMGGCYAETSAMVGPWSTSGRSPFTVPRAIRSWAKASACKCASRARATCRSCVETAA